MKRIIKAVFGVLLLFAFCCKIAWPQDITINSVQAGECSLSVEANDKWHTFRLRAHHPRYRGCRITREQMVSSLAAAFLKTGTPPLKGDYSSLSIGRLIDYPWLSQYLAETAYRDAGWNSGTGKPVKPGVNHYVSHVLFNRKLLEPLQAVLAKAGYRIVGVSVEKVLVGHFDDVPSYLGEPAQGLIPFDAQAWFRLQKETLMLDK